MTLTGRCACGTIQFELTAPVDRVGTCYCTDCQKHTGGGANVIAIVPDHALKLTTGSPRYYASVADSGNTVRRAFCESCGTPLWSLFQSLPIIAVKLGALDNNKAFAIQYQLYASSAANWHYLNPDLPTFAKLPPGK